MSALRAVADGRRSERRERRSPVAVDAVADGRPTASLGLRVALLAGAVIGMADATLVAVALDPLSRHYGVTLAVAQAAIAVYLVTVTAVLPILGRLGDRAGRRAAYLVGFGVFGVGSLICALAPSFATLLVGRIVQAAGGGLLTSGSLALMAQHSAKGRTGRSVALIVVAQAVAGLLGPPVGGVLVAFFGWQSVFWVGLPLALVGAALSLRHLPADRGRRQRSGLDPLGALGLAALLCGVGAGIAGLGGDGIGAVPTWIWWCLALAGLAVLAAVEPRVAHPLLDARLLRGRFGRATAATFLSTGSLMSCLALLPFWLEDAHGASAALAGAALLPVGLGIASTSRRAGRLGDLGHTGTVTASGMGLAALGLTLCALATVGDAWPLLLVGLLVLGAGNGLFSSPNTASAMSVAPRSGLSSAAAMLSTARNAGVIAGLGAVGAAYASVARGHGGRHADDVAGVLFLAAAVICVGVAALALATYRSSGQTAEG